jgi:hypothetical protein
VGRFEELAMHAPQYVANPFGMLTDPQSILRALEGSQRLEGLNRRICRPLDRQAAPKATDGERDSYDHSVDASAADDEAE